ncbi:hypothetical protein N9N67_09925 [Bacteriovoracaceae bacterium]|nr:hypothetical protein [Bacteriovoracaceae bacterium]
MKVKSIILAIVLLSISAFANTESKVQSTEDRYTFLYSGMDAQRSVTLNTEVMRTEMRTVQSWCQRRFCPPTRCRRVCRPNGPCRRVCNRPGPCRVRTVRCMRQVPVQVFDHSVENVVTFFFGQSRQGVSEEFNLKQSGDNFSLDIDSSKRFVVLMDREEVSRRRQGNRDLVTTNLFVNFVDVAPIFTSKSEGIQNIDLKGKLLSFDIPKSSMNLTTKLKILRRKVGSDRVVFNRALGQNDYTIEDNGDFNRLTIDFNRIGVTRPKKMTIELRHGFFAKPGQKVLNANELKRLYDVRIIKYK